MNTPLGCVARSVLGSVILLYVGLFGAMAERRGVKLVMVIAAAVVIVVEARFAYDYGRLLDATAGLLKACEWDLW